MLPLLLLMVAVVMIMIVMLIMIVIIYLWVLRGFFPLQRSVVLFRTHHTCSKSLVLSAPAIFIPEVWIRRTWRWKQVPLKPSSSVEFMINLSIQNFTAFLFLNLFPSRLRNINESWGGGWLKPYTSPSALSFEVKGFCFSLPSLPWVSKGWLKS